MRRAKQASKTWAGREAARPERNILAEFTGAHVEVVSLCSDVQSAGIPLSENARSKLYNTDVGIKLLARRIWRRVAHWRCGPVDRCAGLKNV